jgi:hypothetical protein
MIIEKIEDRDGTVSFEDKESKVKYGRIIGGLAWPAVSSWFALVVAEDFDEDPSKIRHIRVLAEIEDQDPEPLFQKCLELRQRYQIQDFFGNSGDKPMMELLRDFNRDLEDVSSLSLCLAPFPEDFAYHVRVIRERLNQDKKTLHFGEKSILPGCLMELSPEEATKGSVYDHPAIAALGYAVSYFKSHPGRRKKLRHPRRPEESWKTV